jgi:hypothetical protein
MYENNFLRDAVGVICEKLFLKKISLDFNGLVKVQVLIILI